jgi:hypothetical protein
MARYKIITLVDITRSQPSRNETDTIKIGQQANFNSLLQAIGLRSNVSWVTDPKIYTGALPDDLEGKATHWIWEFDAEREDVFLKGSDPIGLLKDDIEGVPVVDQLNNSVDLNPCVFKTTGKNCNIWIYKI